MLQRELHWLLIHRRMNLTLSVRTVGGVYRALDYSTPEARDRILVNTIIYYRADTVLWHKDDSNMACLMHAGLPYLIPPCHS